MEKSQISCFVQQMGRKVNGGEGGLWEVWYKYHKLCKLEEKRGCWWRRERENL